MSIIDKDITARGVCRAEVYLLAARYIYSTLAALYIVAGDIGGEFFITVNEYDTAIAI